MRSRSCRLRVLRALHSSAGLLSSDDSHDDVDAAPGSRAPLAAAGTPPVTLLSFDDGVLAPQLSGFTRGPKGPSLGGAGSALHLEPWQRTAETTSTRFYR